MLEDIIKERRKKLERIREAGIDPYPARVDRDYEIGEILGDWDKMAARDSVAVAGRVMSIRDQGAIIFTDLEDATGKLQIVLKDGMTEDFNFWKEVVDRGDFVSARGRLFVTNRGEKSLETASLQMASKSLLPLPDKWEGLENEELRLRERYVDLVVNPGVREMFKKKTIFWASVRKFLEKQDFIEVETSVMEPMAGGAEAEPFRTHHNALDTDFYLRISLELQLKRLVVGGFDKVFEIGRVFRNEGIDRDHLQDFTFMECYWAYADYKKMMKMLEKMYRFIIECVTGGLKTTYQGHEIDWSAKWPTVDYTKAFMEANDLNPAKASREKLFAKAKELGLEPEPNLEKGRLVDLIYKKTVRPKLIQPCFLVNQPILVSPLSKASVKKPNIAERFQIVAGGTELGNGYSELNDPDEQRRRFEEQMKLREKGDKEAMALDEDFLKALETGLPPTAGFGMSERVFAILMDKPVRETVFFPLMRPRKQSD